MLEWAIRCYRSGMARKAWLEAEVATSSPAATAAWVRRTVRAPATVAQVLTQFLRLICIHRRWQYAEVWYPVMRDGVATPGGGAARRQLRRPPPPPPLPRWAPPSRGRRRR